MFPSVIQYFLPDSALLSQNVSLITATAFDIIFTNTVQTKK